MALCHKCWADAALRAANDGATVVEHYNALLAERQDHPCSPTERSMGEELIHAWEHGDIEAAPGHDNPPTPDQAAEAGSPFTPEQQRIHDELMTRVTGAIYVNAASISKVAKIPAAILPRLIVCAAVHGIQKQIEYYQRREDQHAVIPFTRQERQAVQSRLIEDCTDLRDAMTEAINNLNTTVASINQSTSTLIQ